MTSACSCSCGDCECADGGDFAGEGYFNGASLASDIRDNEMRRMARVAKEESSKNPSRGRRKTRPERSPKSGGLSGGGMYFGRDDEAENSENLEARIRRLERAAGMPNQAGHMAGPNRTGSKNGINGFGLGTSRNGVDGAYGHGMMNGLDGVNGMNRMSGRGRRYGRNPGTMGSNWKVAGQSGFEDDCGMGLGVGMGLRVGRRRIRAAYASGSGDGGADGLGGSDKMKRPGLGTGESKPGASGRVRFERPGESLGGGPDLGGDDDLVGGWEDVGDGL